MFVLVLCLCLGCFLVLVASFLSSLSKLEVRRRLLPRWEELAADEWHVLDWVVRVVGSSDQQRYQLAGDEGAMYLKVQWVLLRSTAAVALLANSVLVPVNLMGCVGLQSFAAADSFNIEEGSSEYWWHTGFGLITPAIMMLTLYQLRAVVTHLEPSPQRLVGLRSIKIFSLPTYKSRHSIQAEKLHKYLTELYGPKVTAVQLAPRIKPLSRLSEKYHNASEGPEAERLKKAIDKLRKKPLESAGTAYVTFETPEDAEIALRSHALPGEGSGLAETFAELGGRFWKMEPAPDPSDVIWRHLGIGSCERMWRVLFLNLAVVILLATVVSPVTVSDYLKRHMGSFVGAVTTQFIPVVVLFLFLWILVPIVLYYACKHEGHELHSDAKDSFIKKYFCYLFVAAVILPLAAMSLGAFVSYLGSSTVEFKSFAKRLYANDSGSQFLRYVMMWALLSTPLELFRFPMQIAAAVSSCCSRKSDSEDRQRHGQIEEFDFALQYALLLHVTSIIFFFSIVSPVILVFGTIYLGLKHVVDLVLLIGCHPKSTRCGVRLVATAQQLFMLCILLHLLGSSCFLIARRAEGSLYYSFLFWLSLVVYLVVLCYQETKEVVDKRKLPPKVRKVLDGEWLTGYGEVATNAVALEMDEGGAAEDGEHVLVGADSTVLREAYKHPWLRVHDEGVDVIGEVIERVDLPTRNDTLS